MTRWHQGEPHDLQFSEKSSVMEVGRHELSNWRVHAIKRCLILILVTVVAKLCASVTLEYLTCIFQTIWCAQDCIVQLC